mgnify:CR=1 FL=1
MGMTKDELLEALASYPGSAVIRIRDKQRIGDERDADKIYGGNDYKDQTALPYVVISG